MRVLIVVIAALLFSMNSPAQCDLGNNGIVLVDAGNTTTVTGGCIGTEYNFRFSVMNYGTGCTLIANTVFASFSFPTISGGIKPYIYNGPANFSSGYFSWTYDAFNQRLVGTNTAAIPAGNGDAVVLVRIIGNAEGSGSSVLNLLSGPNSNSNLANDNGIAQLSVDNAPSITNQPNQSQCNSAEFTMTQGGTGIWSLVNGTATITNPASPTSTVTGVSAGTSATLRWTVSNGACSVFDDVTVTNNLPPNISVSSIGNNICHGGNTGSISVTTGLGYSFTIAGPTVNTTGQSTGIFTGLTAGAYAISVTANGCSNTVAATVTEPAGTLPDISLGSDYDANFFTAVGAESNIVFNIAEIAGNPATGDTVRIIRIPGYSFTFDAAAANILIGSTTYPLDNNRWKLDESNPSFISIIFDPAHNSVPGTLNCGSRVYIAIKFKRNTANISTFSLSARLRKADNEVGLLNNLNTIVFTAE